jgi:hypothetical protein
MRRFLETCQTLQELTTNVFDVVEVHLRGRAKLQDVVIRARSSMERCRRDSKVVRHHKRLFMGKGGLRTGRSPRQDTGALELIEISDSRSRCPQSIWIEYSLG